MQPPPDDSMVIVDRVAGLPLGIDGLIEASEAEGYAHVRRLAEAWLLGTNRFDASGEVLLEGRAADGDLVGVCGLNHDPFGDPDERAGRVRRLYVAPMFRGRGIGRRLVGAVETEARAHFDVLVLRTHDAGAGAFYERLGYACVQGVEHRTHAKELGHS